jgi:hypothetical protein
MHQNSPDVVRFAVRALESSGLNVEKDPSHASSNTQDTRDDTFHGVHRILWEGFFPGTIG